MTRRRTLFVLACGLAGLTATVLGFHFARAAETAQRVVRGASLGRNRLPPARGGSPRSENAFSERGRVEGRLLDTRSMHMMGAKEEVDVDWSHLVVLRTPKVPR